MSSNGTLDEFTADSTAAVLDELCRDRGWRSQGAELLRLGQNATYRLPDQPLVVRVSRTRDLAALDTEVRVARWLANADFPATQLSESASSAQPIRVADRYVTIWELLDEGPTPADTEDLASLLHRLHALPWPDDLNLPPFNPFDRVPERLESAPGSIKPDDIAFLLDLSIELQEAYADIQFSLPIGPIHSDAHLGNLLKSANGQAFLLDLEYFSIGPREWDIMLPAAYRYGFEWITEAEYRRFVQTYGHDVSHDPCFATLRRVREFNMTLWLMQNVDHSEALRAEFTTRVRDLRNPNGIRRWKRV